MGIGEHTVARQVLAAMMARELRARLRNKTP
jgi:hypothetical protein